MLFQRSLNELALQLQFPSMSSRMQLRGNHSSQEIPRNFLQLQLHDLMVFKLQL